MKLNVEMFIELLIPCMNSMRESPRGVIFYIFFDDKKHVMSAVTYDRHYNVFMIHRPEPVASGYNDFDLALSLIYPLYASIRKIQTQLEEAVGGLIKMEKLWGWGTRDLVHRALDNDNFVIRNHYPSLNPGAKYFLDIVNQSMTTNRHRITFQTNDQIIVGKLCNPQSG
jgi:hypothetical protein